jgi:hypothetical protein
MIQMFHVLAMMFFSALKSFVGIAKITMFGA